MIRTLLIANRGEIACRIVDTARRLGIRTVAVYSDADAGARHVRMADEAHWIGAAPATESYLNAERLLEVAVAASADAIHPGYGFLAENAGFARACAAAGIRFVGPPPEAIESMAMKGAAKSLMQDAGVPTLPGMNEITLPDDIPRITAEVGFPLLVKPAAGGGGKGMRVVREAADLEAALESAAREAASSFGDDRLIVERYLETPRHVEVQIFADTHGNALHLNERDCSLQRRHQKIIEEAPAPGMSAALRRRMGEAAVAAAASIGYTGAGTVEFLVEEDEFFFMEMNTRLQVEHPVTELITGLDLVEWQLIVANGDELPLAQEQIGIGGHAMEARLYAEDPANDFLPVAGRIDFMQLPAGIRIDRGVDPGDSVSVFYDPMIAKVIVHAADRPACLAALREALTSTMIGGISTNRDFLLRAIDEPAMQEGRVWTSFLDQHRIFEAPASGETAILAALAAVALSARQPLPNFRLNAVNRSRLRFYDDLSPLDLVVTCRNRDWHIEADGQPMTVDEVELQGVSLRARVNGQETAASILEYDENVLIVTAARSLTLRRALPDALQQEAGGSLRSPMSGKVIDIRVAVGDAVEAGETLVVLEAMKMEHTVSAPAAGIVAAIHFEVGAVVADGVELIAIEESE